MCVFERVCVCEQCATHKLLKQFLWRFTSHSLSPKHYAQLKDSEEVFSHWEMIIWLLKMLIYVIKKSLKQYLSISLYLSVCLSIHPSIYLSTHTHTHIHTHMHTRTHEYTHTPPPSLHTLYYAVRHPVFLLCVGHNESQSTGLFWKPKLRNCL